MTIKLLIVDDSALVRQSLASIFEREADIEVVGAAGDPFSAAAIIRDVIPDVILLDVEMPRMDGITFLRRIMSQRPIPVVICSTLVGKQSETHMRALESGAVDIIQKPNLSVKNFFEEQGVRIADAVRAASHARLRKLVKNQRYAKQRAQMPTPETRAMAETTEKVIVIGASTGGTEAIKSVLLDMPLNAPAIAIVQHMPPVFTQSFAQRLDEQCQIRVKEAKDGDSLIRGHALIAPGDKHMKLKRRGAQYYVELDDGPMVSRHKPSVDVLFQSASKYAGKNCAAAILTGMGKDGAEGLQKIREVGAYTIGQDESTSVVYGMPKEAFDRGAVKQQLPLEKIAQGLLKASGYV